MELLVLFRGVWRYLLCESAHASIDQTLQCEPDTDSCTPVDICRLEGCHKCPVLACGKIVVVRFLTVCFSHGMIHVCSRAVSFFLSFLAYDTNVVATSAVLIVGAIFGCWSRMLLLKYATG